MNLVSRFWLSELSTCFSVNYYLLICSRYGSVEVNWSTCRAAELDSKILDQLKMCHQYNASFPVFTENSVWDPFCFLFY